LERNAQSLLSSLNQMDRTLGHRRHDLNALLASVTGRESTHMDSQRGKVCVVRGSLRRWLSG